MPQHSYVPFGVSDGASSFDERIRPSLHHAYPLPEGHGADTRFAALLDALAQRSGHARQIAREDAPAL